MNDGANETDSLDENRRRVLRAGGAIAGALSVFGISGTAGATGGGPIARDGERLPLNGEPIGEPHPACGDDTPPEPSASDANERYLELLGQALHMRDSNRPNMDYDAIRGVLRDRNEGFDGHLIFFAGSDFGEPRVFLPEAISDQQAALNAILDRIHEQKWRADSPDLRDVRHRMFEDVRGIHQGLPALYRDNGSAEYDIEFPWNRVYNFVTIRQVVGLVDWVTNAQDPWLDGLRLTY